MNTHKIWLVKVIGGLSLLAGLSCVSMKGYAQPPSSEIEREFKAAMSAQDKGDLETAKTKLLSLHRRHPGIFAVDESLGLVFVAQERYADALPYLQAAVHEQPGSDVAHANLGAAYFKLHRNQDALRELQRAEQIDPRNVATQQGLGEIYLEEGKPRQAADAFAAALKLKPDDADLQLNHATALVASGELDSAEQEIAAIPGADTNAAAQSLLGDIAEKKHDYQAAGKYYDRAMQLDPSEQSVWAFGAELLRHWTFDPAIQVFEAGVAKYPQSLRMKLALGAAYFGAAKYPNSIPVFADLLDAEPNNALYAEMLGIACTSVTESAKVRCSGLTHYAEAHPRDAKVSTYVASMLLTETATEDHTQLARKLLEQAIAADPKLADAYYEFGVLKQSQGDWAGSVAQLEKALALKPNLAQAHYRLALAYWRTGRKADGQAQMEMQRKYAKQQQEDLNHRLEQITTFIVDVHK